MKNLGSHLALLACAVLLLLPAPADAQSGVNLLPSPREIHMGGGEFQSGPRIGIAVGESPEDRFAAQDLAARLQSDFGVHADLGPARSGKTVTLLRGGVAEKFGEQGYELRVEPARITVRANGAAGLFYATRTLLQLAKTCGAGFCVPGAAISDWPDIPARAVHYDTKHHQDRAEYVREFIRTLADYKINMLVWEWEDKFAYQSHPEIGAPGAFTKTEMQAFTRYARQYHVQLVPLVQGLGHVSYILKWPQHSGLREIAASNWEFCPRKEGTYKLLADLWREAAEATPGSEYLHIGTDETYELGAGAECGCKARMQEVGRYGLMQDFVKRSDGIVTSLGRKTMSWGGEYKPEEKIRPPQGLTATIIENAAGGEVAKKAGYPAWIYDPNPGIEHLFLPYVYRLADGKETANCLEESQKLLSAAASSHSFDGMISTSWDDSGVHTSIWMMRFIHAAAYSWNGTSPEPGRFADRFFEVHYGPRARDLPELWNLLNRGAYFYMDAFGRKVWHWGNLPKDRPPDWPRGDAIEYLSFWNRENRDMLERSRSQLKAMERAQEICRANRAAGVRRAYDFELFDSLAALIAHTARTYLALGAVEEGIGRAQERHFTDSRAAADALDGTVQVLQQNLAERDEIFHRLTATWEKGSLPKGLALPDKAYFHQQDRARHFANRRAGISYLIYDEQLLGLEAYLDKLRDYAAWYRKTYVPGKEQE